MRARASAAHAEWCVSLPVLNKAAAKAMRTSLTAIESVLVRRDFCERACAAERISANSFKSAAMCARIALLSGGVRELPLACTMPNGV